MQSQMVKSTLRVGAVAGIVAWFLALVGMIERLSDLSIIGTSLTMDQLLIFLPSALAGWVAVRPRVVAGEIRSVTTGSALAAGAAAGLAAGAAVAAGLGLVNLIGPESVRTVFISLSPTTLDQLYLGLEPVVGTAVLVIGMVAVAAVFAGLRSVPAAVHRPIVAGLAGIVAMALLERVVAPAFDEMGIEKDWLYSKAKGGLELIGAVVTFVVVAVAVHFSVASKVRDILLPGRARDPFVAAVTTGAVTEGEDEAVDRAASEDEHPLGRGLSARALQIIAWLVIAGLLAWLPSLVGPVVSRILGLVGIYLLLGLGLNIVVGYAGLLDLGYVFFFALGAYSLALLTGATLNAYGIPPEPAISGHLNFYLAIPLVMVIAAGAGVLVGAPVLRLRGDYLALVTLGLGEMVTVLVKSPWLVPLVGGPSGMRGISDAAIGGLAFREPQRFYYLALAFVGLAAFVSWRLASSRIGRAWTAMREDEQTADAMGISTTRFKLLAFAIGGAIGSLGGALFAVKIGSLTPASFEVIVSIQVLGLVILGGMGSIPGVIVGALVLVGLPGLLREFEEYRFLAYGAAVVAVMVLRPQGLVPNVRRSRELQDEERAQDEWAKAVEEGETPPEIAGATGAAT